MRFIKKRVKEDYANDEDFYDEGYYGDGAKEAEAAPEETYAADNRAGVAFTGGSSPVALKVVRPRSYDEAPEIADYLADGSTVLLNIDNMDKNATKRLLDFLLGATHVLGGTMNMVTKETFVFAPKSVGVADVSSEEEAVEEISDEETEI